MHGVWAWPLGKRWKRKEGQLQLSSLVVAAVPASLHCFPSAVWETTCSHFNTLDPSHSLCVLKAWLRGKLSWDCWGSWQFPQQSRTCSSSSRRVNQQQDRAAVAKRRFSNLTGEVMPGCLSSCVCVSMCLYKPLCLFFSSTASLKTNLNNSRKTAAAVWCIRFSAIVYQKKIEV